MRRTKVVFIVPLMAIVTNLSMKSHQNNATFIHFFSICSLNPTLKGIWIQNVFFHFALWSSFIIFWFATTFPTFVNCSCSQMPPKRISKVSEFFAYQRFYFSSFRIRWLLISTNDHSVTPASSLTIYSTSFGLNIYTYICSLAHYLVSQRSLSDLISITNTAHVCSLQIIS